MYGTRYQNYQKLWHTHDPLRKTIASVQAGKIKDNRSHMVRFHARPHSVQHQLMAALICTGRCVMLQEQITHHLSPPISNQQQVIAFNYCSTYPRNNPTYIMDIQRHTCNYSQHSSDYLSQNNYLSGGSDSQGCDNTAGKGKSHYSQVTQLNRCEEHTLSLDLVRHMQPPHPILDTPTHRRCVSECWKVI